MLLLQIIITKTKPMVSTAVFRQLALAFEDALEVAHFEKTSFRVNEKIFATLDSNNNTAVVKLSPLDQSVFCAFDKSIIYPGTGKWGLHGWTKIELNKVGKIMLKDALTCSYCTVAPKKLAEKYREENF